MRAFRCAGLGAPRVARGLCRLPAVHAAAPLLNRRSQRSAPLAHRALLPRRGLTAVDSRGDAASGGAGGGGAGWNEATSDVLYTRRAAGAARDPEELEAFRAAVEHRLDVGDLQGAMAAACARFSGRSSWFGGAVPIMESLMMALAKECRGSQLRDAVCVVFRAGGTPSPGMVRAVETYFQLGGYEMCKRKLVSCASVESKTFKLLLEAHDTSTKSSRPPLRQLVRLLIDAGCTPNEEVWAMVIEVATRKCSMGHAMTLVQHDMRDMGHRPGSAVLTYLLRTLTLNRCTHGPWVRDLLEIISEEQRNARVYSLALILATRVGESESAVEMLYRLADVEKPDVLLCNSVLRTLVASGASSEARTVLDAMARWEVDADKDTETFMSRLKDG
mmetsp:Transcript_10185/g.34683  ORF Transcript_10185/g.34683 Transcript_10185/m.34683 type:complete len:389 (+) Transcript_10185:127-1293(+)